MQKTSRIVSILVSFLVLVGSIIALANYQQILDALALRNYSPDATVVALADKTTMQDGTRRIFYVNHPELNNKDQFRTNCPATEQSIVLGCYVDRKGIYLLKVDDERLNGVVEVTAAHEVLHAHYQRLSSSERQKIDAMTASFFAGLNNDRVKNTVEQYREKDASVVPNELHSILATEVRQLSPELEAYYSKYFKDRSQIVALSEKYEQAFVSLTTQVENYDKQLQDLKATIDANQKKIDAAGAQIESQRNRLDSLMNSRQTDAYNAQVDSFNQQVNSYNALIRETRNLVDQHNEIVEKRNAIATAEKELIDAINSNVTPKQTQ